MRRGLVRLVVWSGTWFLAVVTDLVGVVARGGSALLRRDPITRTSLRSRSTWRRSIADPCPPRAAWGPTPLDGPRTKPRRLTVGRVAAIVAVLLVLDVAVGSFVSTVRGGPERAPGRVADLSPTYLERPTIEVPVRDNPVAEAPALADVPWARDFFRELSTVVSYDQPFILFSETDHQGRYLNIRDGIRDSYVAPGSEDGPVVWFFGASTMLGWAQRDDHTIPSEVARLAEADGHPIQAVNFGVPGYLNMQETLLFEQQVAERGAPDLVVFYDGSNDIAANIRQAPTDDPTLLDDPLNAGMRMQGIVPSADPLIDGNEIRSWAWWTSGSSTWEPEAVQRAMRSYGRSNQIARDLAEQEGTTMRVFFQPQKTLGTRIALAQKYLPDGVIDLSGSLDGDGQDTYIDVVHTNERGSRLVAEAMYPHLAADIERLSGTRETG